MAQFAPTTGASNLIRGVLRELVMQEKVLFFDTPKKDVTLAGLFTNPRTGLTQSELKRRPF